MCTSFFAAGCYGVGFVNSLFSPGEVEQGNFSVIRERATHMTTLVTALKVKFPRKDFKKKHTHTHTQKEKFDKKNDFDYFPLRKIKMAHRFLVTKSVVPIGQQHILDTVANLLSYPKSDGAAPGVGSCRVSSPMAQR